MLDSISIQNFAIVKELNLDLKPGLNIITGETGAGKSVIIEAISMALGSRADTSYVRSGQDKAVISLVVDTDDCNIDKILDDLGIPNDNPMVIRREISSSGKSICRVNGAIVPLSSLNLLCKNIADIHGQYDQQTLLDTDNHLRILDLYGGNELNSLKKKTSDAYSLYIQNKNELNELKKNLADSERQKDFLQFQYDEINTAKLRAGEDEELEEDIRLLENSERLYSVLNECYSQVYERENSANSILSKSLSSLEGITGISKNIDELVSRFNDAFYEIDDIDNQLRSLKDSITFSQSELDEKIDRFETIKQLKKKYGSTIDDILAFAEDAKKKLLTIDSGSERISSLEKSIEESKALYDKISSRLSEKRKEVAVILEGLISKELFELNFNDARFSIKLNPVDCGANGNETAEFLIATNKGSELQSLAKIVSGGELSRIMLALKRIIGDLDGIPTMIFDEIDTGISGATADIVGNKLNDIAENRQVICITHLPQIAVKGNNHYRITKVSDEISTSTTVVPLGINERIEEIARLLSGSTITDSARKQAKELLNING